MVVCLSASRQSNELPAKATIANKVSSKVRVHDIRDSISEEIDNGKLSFSYGYQFVFGRRDVNRDSSRFPVDAFIVMTCRAVVVYS
jgi:hypothetical protein